MMTNTDTSKMEKWQFTKTPFSRELRVENRVAFDFMRQAKETIMRAIQECQSVAVVGPAGCGKTVLLRSVIADLPPARYSCTYVKLTELSPRDFCRKVAAGLGLSPRGTLPALLQAIEDALKEGFFNRAIRPVIILDDVHELKRPAFKLVRLLTNYEMDSRLLVSFVLVGQTPLKQVLLTPELEDVHQRLVSCVEIRRLSREETRDYVVQRVREAGSPLTVFSPDAIEALYEISRGNMRALDRLARAALHLACCGTHDLVNASDVASARAEVWS